MKKRMDVTIPRRHPMAFAACGFMAVSAAVRLWHYLAQPVTAEVFWVHLFLPTLAAAVFLAGMALGGRYAKGGVAASVVLGVAFFILKAFDFALWHQILCTLLYLGVLVLTLLTLSGRLPTKKLLYPLFSLPLAYHIVVEDTQKYFFARPPVPVWQWMPEISVLCIMAGLLCLSFALQTERLA